jgi:TatD DNase family protein
LIDSHVHLNRHEFAAESIEVIDRARQAGVRGFLNVGYDLVSSRESMALAAADPDILATVGIHPHDALMLADESGQLTIEGEAALVELEEMAADPRVVAIGEIGLDFFRDLSPRPAQRTALTVQLELADRVGLPVVFHVRDAWSETLEHIDKCGVRRATGVLHSFSGDEDCVTWARERGFLLGIGGPVTYKNSPLPALVAQAGVEMILLETDAPWLPPVPYRGKRNEPSYLPRTLHKVAEILDMDPAAVARKTTESFCRLFGKLAARRFS